MDAKDVDWVKWMRQPYLMTLREWGIENDQLLDAIIDNALPDDVKMELLNRLNPQDLEFRKLNRKIDTLMADVAQLRKDVMSR